MSLTFEERFEQFSLALERGEYIAWAAFDRKFTKASGDVQSWKVKCPLCRRHHFYPLSRDCDDLRERYFLIGRFVAECDSSKSLTVYHRMWKRQMGTRHRILNRKPIPAAVKQLVWRKTLGHCWYCGEDVSTGASHAIDHQHPIALGGSNDYDNLVLACRECNASKADKPLEYYRAQCGGGLFWDEVQQGKDGWL